eukprot:gene1209-1785_t
MKKSQQSNADREATAYAAFVAKQKAYFAKVDAYELAEEEVGVEENSREEALVSEQLPVKQPPRDIPVPVQSESEHLPRDPVAVVTAEAKRQSRDAAVTAPADPEELPRDTAAVTPAGAERLPALADIAGSSQRRCALESAIAEAPDEPGTPFAASTNTGGQHTPRIGSGLYAKSLSRCSALRVSLQPSPGLPGRAMAPKDAEAKRPSCQPPDWLPRMLETELVEQGLPMFGRTDHATSDVPTSPIWTWSKASPGAARQGAAASDAERNGATGLAPATPSRDAGALVITPSNAPEEARGSGVSELEPGGGRLPVELSPLAVQEGAIADSSTASPREEADAADIQALEEAVPVVPDITKVSLDTHQAVVEEKKVPTLTAALTPMQKLLQECGQADGSIPSLKQMLHDMGVSKPFKIGEGTFGEAFKAAGVVLKIVPMEGDIRVNGEIQKRAEDMLGETAIAQRLTALRWESQAGRSPANATDTFIDLRRVAVCKGRYAPSLVSAWEEWDKINRSENDHPRIFPAKQHYIIFITADGGRELEKFEFREFIEARSVLLQTGLALAVAEEDCRFEHRDLHWGNVLISRIGDSRAMEGVDATFSHHRLNGVDVHANNEGLRVAIIDFTLSRVDTLSGDIAFCNLSDDPEIFQGPAGDCQMETYRRMRKVTKDRWDNFTPKTNVYWLHYLADTLLNKKSLPCTPEEKHSLKSFRKDVLRYKSASEAVWDTFFSSSWIAGNMKS